MAFQFGSVLLVKSTETGLAVFFQLCALLVSVCDIAKLNLFGTGLNSDFLTIILGGRLPET